VAPRAEERCVFVTMLGASPFGQQQFGGMAGGSPQQQFAPQGFFGDLLGSVAQPLGGAIGGMFGHQQLGNQLGGMGGQLAHLLPFSAQGPQGFGGQMGGQGQWGGQQGQFAPQGFIGDMLGSVAQPLGSTIGAHFGHQQLGSQLGGLGGQLAQLLPFSAQGPQMGGMQPEGQFAPQGFLGGLLGGTGGGALGNWIGGQFGNPGLGKTIGSAAGGVLGGLLPFSAQGPQGFGGQMGGQGQWGGQQGQFAPQGFFGDLLGSVAQPLGGAIGGMFGHQQLGNQLGGMGGQLAHLLPFSAQGPQGWG
jgi:hypothetical protein